MDLPSKTQKETDFWNRITLQGALDFPQFSLLPPKKDIFLMQSKNWPLSSFGK